MLLVFMIRALNAFDVETRRRLEAANQARLNALNQVVDAQEVERKRIARELHDATGQSLTAIALGLRGVETHIEHCDSLQPALLETVREIKSYSTSALGELHQIIADLRPSILDDMGLAAALKWYVQSYQQRRSLPTELIVEGTSFRLPAEYETVLFRITQEALTNIAKHARATRVVVTLGFSPAEVSLQIKDNGRGFDPGLVLQRTGRSSGWGLLGMRERASLIGGQVAIESSPGQGTRIRVTVPTSRELLRVKDTSAVS
jgi:signal transduction histidine kinase